MIIRRKNNNKEEVERDGSLYNRVRVVKRSC